MAFIRLRLRGAPVVTLQPGNWQSKCESDLSLGSQLFLITKANQGLFFFVDYMFIVCSLFLQNVGACDFCCFNLLIVLQSFVSLALIMDAVLMVIWSAFMGIKGMGGCA